MSDQKSNLEVVSKRSQEAPMDFTFGELSKGALDAWLIFNLLLPFGVTIWEWFAAGPAAQAFTLLPLFIMTLIVGGIISLPSSLLVDFVIGVPLAYGIGKMLRKVKKIWIHLPSFLVLGIAVGVSAGYLSWRLLWGRNDSMSSGNDSAFGIAFVVTLTLLTAISVLLGWFLAYSRAMRSDAKLRTSAEALTQNVVAAPEVVKRRTSSTFLNSN
ncbi:MAG: hypothetical protein KF867_03105 [Cryobacterium sp.]|nr:hypothetical protein [Cryobacterium sp.]